MRENTLIRFALADKLLSMRYGDSLVIPREQIKQAWPPTGDHDTSFEGAFHAMALASSGNRPEESYTTDERIENDLDGTFSWQASAETGDYIFRRLIRHCPRCHGSGHYRTPSADPGPAPDLTLDIADAEVFTETIVECDHHP